MSFKALNYALQTSLEVQVSGIVMIRCSVNSPILVNRASKDLPLILLFVYYPIAERGKRAIHNDIPMISGTIAGALTLLTLIIAVFVRQRYL